MNIPNKEVKYENVIFYNGMENDRARVKEILNNNGFNLIDRFDKWSYLLNNKIVMNGKVIG